jgi:type IV pilus assembly protein PilB
VLAEQLGVPSVNLAHFACDRDAIDAVGPDLARKHMVMPLYRTGTRIAVGIENPLSWDALQVLERATPLTVDPAIASREDLEAAIARAYGPGAATEHPPRAPVARPVELAATTSANDDLGCALQPDLVTLATSMVSRAFRAGTLTVHAEALPGGTAGALRFRVEGTLEP